MPTADRFENLVLVDRKTTPGLRWARGGMDTDLPPTERRQALIAILMIGALKAGDTHFRLGGTPR